MVGNKSSSSLRKRWVELEQICGTGKPDRGDPKGLITVWMGSSRRSQRSTSTHGGWSALISDDSDGPVRALARALRFCLVRSADAIDALSRPSAVALYLAVGWSIAGTLGHLTGRIALFGISPEAAPLAFKRLQCSSQMFRSGTIPLSAFQAFIVIPRHIPVSAFLVAAL